MKDSSLGAGEESFFTLVKKLAINTILVHTRIEEV
jgi:hypothetical protein